MTDADDDEESPVEIPLDQLSSAALLGVIDDFVLREGTDYGTSETSLPQKRQQIMQQLQSGRARLVFDARSESCTILLAQDVPADD
jgi:uncharacterized protein YheU (UPF0270 family)